MTVVMLLFIAGGFVLPAATQLGNATYQAKVLGTPQGSMCPASEQLQMTRNVIRNETRTIIRDQILPSYECGGTSGWRRVAFVNMTDPNQQCPSGLALNPSYTKRTCGRTNASAAAGTCDSTSFSVGDGATYSRVCGRIIGYQLGATSAFYPYNRNAATTIDSYYVVGVSLTHGSPGARQHIWTFAAGLTEVDGSFITELCPCSTTGNVRIPPFVGNDYFCESGFNTTWNYQFVLFPDDALWDGQNCRAGTTCCQFNTPPWFTKDLPSSTSDDIELRLCHNYRSGISDVPLELIELYVK